MDTRFLPQESIDNLNFAYGWKIGDNCKIATSAVLDCKELEIGNNSIISDFAIITGRIKIGKYSHIAHRVHLSGTHGINAGDHFTIGAGSIVYTESDDHKGEYLIGPQIPNNLRSCYSSPVTFADFCAVSVGCVIMPGSQMQEGSMLRLKSNLFGTICVEWCEYGSPNPHSNATIIRKRSKEQKELVKKLG
jgi:acetyltransferase-like isoleucine patch superfamily enzyme